MSSYKDFLNSNEKNSNISGSDSDESDEDYVPTGAKLSAESSGDSSDEEILGDDLTKQKSSKNNVEKEVCKDDIPPIDKKRANEIWSDFLADVNNVPSKKSTTESSNVSKLDEKATEIGQLPKPSNDVGNEKKIDMVEFAGETFSLSSGSALVKMPCASEDPKPVLNGNSSVTNIKTPVSTPSVSAPLKRSGLSSVLGNISQKKKKLSTLEKTLYDWKSFKQEEGIEEELQNHNKGKEGYIEKQRFLERSDWRSYEVERSIKFNKRKP